MSDLFWVNGTGNWSDATNHWATTSGGLPGVGNLPTAADSVFFDSLSNATAYTVTLDAVNKVCLDFNMAAPLTGAVTWAGAQQLTISGSLNLSGGAAGITRTYTGGIVFNSTASGKTVDANGVTLDNAISFNGVGGAWTLSNDLNTSTGTTTLTNGDFGTGSKTLTTLRFSSSNANARTITFGSGGKIVTTETSFVTVFDCGTSTNLTVTRSGGTIEIGGNVGAGGSRTFAGGGATWPTLTYTNTTPGGQLNFTGSNTFKSLAYSGGKAVTVGFTAGTTTTVEDDTTGFFSGTSNNILTVASITASGHTLAKSGGGVINSSYLSISRSTATPASTWNATTYAVDGGNNSGWNFPIVAAQGTVLIGSISGAATTRIISGITINGVNVLCAIAATDGSYGSGVSVVSPTGNIVATQGYTTNAKRDAVKAAIIARINTCAIGGYSAGSTGAPRAGAVATGLTYINAPLADGALQNGFVVALVGTSITGGNPPCSTTNMAGGVGGPHATTGTLSGLSSTLTSVAAHVAKHASSGALSGSGSVLAGTAARAHDHPSTGVLAGSIAAISGSAARSSSVPGVTHTASGALAGTGPAVAGTAHHAAKHASNGTLAGPGALVIGAAHHVATHLANGTLIGEGSVLNGIARGPGGVDFAVALEEKRRYLHEISGRLIGGRGMVSGEAQIIKTGQNPLALLMTSN